VRRMVMQEGAPALTRRIAFLGHVLGDGRLSDRKAELEQFTVNNSSCRSACPEIFSARRMSSTRSA
jgi:hypothetical protein